MRIRLDDPDDVSPADREAFVSAAREVHGGDEVEVDNDAAVSLRDGGAWVAAWVFVTDEEAGVASPDDPGDDGEGD